MSSTGNRYSNEFKQQLVELFQSGQSVTKLSREYGIPTGTIYKWTKELTPVITEDGKAVTPKEIISSDPTTITRKVTKQMKLTTPLINGDTLTKCARQYKNLVSTSDSLYSFYDAYKFMIDEFAHIESGVEALSDI